MEKFYMIEFEIPKTFVQDGNELMILQRREINQLMLDGKIQAFSISSKKSQLWIIASAKSEFEVMELISTFPLNEMMIPTIHLLELHKQNSPQVATV